MENRKLHFLLAEDDLVNQKVAEKVLSRAGFTIEIASNGQEAVEAFKQKSFDAILMDVHMPVLDGYQATQQIREFEDQNGGHIQIIAMTASVMSGDMEKCLDAGMDDYMSKPIDIVELNRKLQNSCIKHPTLSN